MSLISHTLQAQELTVKGMQVTNDLSASIYERKDLNGTPCALVKVQLPSLGVIFEGNVIPPVEYKTGEYWVYMSKGSRELRIKHPQTQPLHVNFRDYNIKSVESRTTYNLSVQMPIIEEGVPMAKAGNPQLPDWLNSTQPNHWIGVSPRTTDRKKARSAAIINAVLGYLRANKEGKCEVKHWNDIYDEYNSNKISAYTNSIVTYNGFSCEIVDEYYNSRGEYFVRCGFVDNKQSKNQLKLFQTHEFTKTDNQEEVHSSASVLLLLNDQDYYSCDFDYDPSHDSGSYYQIKINNEPLIPATNMEYDKCLWNEHGNGSPLHFQLGENGQSLGVATLAVYSFLPFIPKSIKCTGKVATESYMNSSDVVTTSFLAKFIFTADTLCYPVPIHFLSLNGSELSIQIGNVNLQEKELETWRENFGEPIGKRWLERQEVPFTPDYNGNAIMRINKTCYALFDAFANLSTKFHAEISDNVELSSDDIQTSKRVTFQDLSNADMEFNDIGIRWYFENMPTQEQYRKMERQYLKTRKHPRWPGFFIAAEYHKGN